MGCGLSKTSRLCVKLWPNPLNATQDVPGASLGRVNERLAGGQPGTLTAWLRHRQRQMLQRYCVQKLTRVRCFCMYLLIVMSLQGCWPSAQSISGIRALH